MVIRGKSMIHKGACHLRHTQYDFNFITNVELEDGYKITIKNSGKNTVIKI